MIGSCNVSVVIPCYNHGEFLPEAVGSVLAMQRSDVELIVVDDGSTDERTAKEMDALRAKKIRVVRQENQGLSGARNAGIRASNGRYILPLDADNHLRPGYVDHGIRILESQPQVGIVYGDAEYIGTRTGRWHVGPFTAARLMHWNFIDACAVYRREVWEQNHGYDDSTILEDWDFWLGALEHGWKFVYVAEILFDYRVAHESMVTRKSEPEIKAQTARSIAMKHGLLYRDAWLHLVDQKESLKWTSRNLSRLLEARLKRRFQKNGEKA
jgi:glycosyltransferase involved in cell wall biosynthesis